MNVARGFDRRHVIAAGAAATLLALAFALAVRTGGETPSSFARPDPLPVPAAGPDESERAQVPRAPSADPLSLARGLGLQGTLGGSAIFLLPGGGERLVRIGQPILPGLVLKRVHVDHALLDAGGAEIRIELNRFGAAGGSVKAVTPAPASASAQPILSQAGQRDSVAYRLGLAPRKEGDRITGYQIRRGAQLPALQKAGLQPGDVLIAVNGQPLLSGEKIEELPQEIAGSYTAEFEFERNGRRMKGLLEVNPRP